jgi:hypothetical protein
MAVAGHQDGEDRETDVLAAIPTLKKDIVEKP